MTNGPKRKEAPSEPFKRVLGFAVRAIAGDHEVEVGFGPGKPALEGKHVRLPEPSRVPSRGEIAVIRGWADSLALTAACHDEKVHRRLAPAAGSAREVFESIERARIEAIGANRMDGMAENLTAKCEDQFAHGRFAHVTDRAEAPLEEALALLVRERLTGRAPPATAKALVDLWRPLVEQRAGKVLKKMDALADDQESFGRLARDLLKALELAEDLAEGEAADSAEDENETPDGGEQDAESDEDGGEGGEDEREETLGDGEAGEAVEQSEIAGSDRDRRRSRCARGRRDDRALAAQCLRAR